MINKYSKIRFPSLSPIIQQKLKQYENSELFDHSKKKNPDKQMVSPILNKYKWQNYRSKRQKTKTLGNQYQKYDTNDQSATFSQENTITNSYYKNKSSQRRRFDLPKINRIQNQRLSLNQIQSQIYESNLISKLRQQQQYKSTKNKYRFFHQLYNEIPKQCFQRKQDNIRKFVRKCHTQNPFFNKLEYMTVVEFIKCSNIFTYFQGEYIYNKNIPCQSNYIIIWGSILVYNQQLKIQKVYYMGMTLNQQYFLQKKKGVKKNESGRALQNTGLLEVNYDNIQHIKNVLIQYYLTSDIKKIEAIYKKNYLQKQSKIHIQKYRLKEQ